MNGVPDADTPRTATASPTDSRRALLAFVLPLVVYMTLQTLEPTPPESPATAAGVDLKSPADDLLGEVDLDAVDFAEPEEQSTWIGLSIPGKYYPAMYTLKIVVTLAVVLWFLPIYLQWPLKVSMLAVVLGVVGGGLWILCCWIDVEGRLLQWLGEDHMMVEWLALGQRPAYNALGALGETALGYAFLAVRFFGLVLLVPVIEEAFLRAFLMRFVMHDNWSEIPFGVVNRTAMAAGIVVPVLYHPEHLAALVWFSLVTWLMIRTKNYWDCVAAHAITNLILGIVVVTTGWWELW